MDRQTISIILTGVLVTLLALALLRGNEDDWMCQRGQWIKHGQPAAPMPTTPCR